MALAADNACESLAFSAISCGVYGFPVTLAARLAVDEILAPAPGSEFPSRVLLVCFGQAVQDAYTRALAQRRTP
jgi:O-acetyl-ADP-ribose deacetylase (regulator of RNase III)